MIEGRRVARLIYARLAADTGAGGVHTLLSGRLFSRRVPQAALLPACVIQLVSATPLNTRSGNRVLKETLVDVHLIAEGSDIGPLVPIADRIDTVLQGGQGLQDGVNVVKMVLVDEREYDEDESGKVYVHQIQSYRTSVYRVPA